MGITDFTGASRRLSCLWVTVVLFGAQRMVMATDVPPTPDSNHEISTTDSPHAMTDHSMAVMTGAYGNYPLTREASGTSWQPDSSIHAGVHAMAGDWMLMGHSLLNGVYDRQRASRG